MGYRDESKPFDDDVVALNHGDYWETTVPRGSDCNVEITRIYYTDSKPIDETDARFNSIAVLDKYQDKQFESLPTYLYYTIMRASNVVTLKHILPESNSIKNFKEVSLTFMGDREVDSTTTNFADLYKAYGCIVKFDDTLCEDDV